MKCIIVACLIIVSSSLFAQDKALLKIKNYPKDDSIKVELMVDYCVNSTFQQSPKILKIAEEAAALSKKINYKVGEIHSLSCIGNYYYLIADYPKAVNYYNRSLKLAESIQSVDNIVIGYNNLANLYSKAREPQKAIALFKKSDALLIQKGDSISQHRAAILVNLSDVYYSINDYKNAIRRLQEALSISEEIKSDFGFIICNSNLGSIYRKLNKFDDAFFYLEKAYNKSLQIDNTFLMSQIEVYLGACYAHFNDHKKARYFFDQSIEHGLKDNNNESLILIYEEVQNYYEQKGNFEKAHLYLKKLMQLKDKIADVETNKAISDINTKYETAKKESRIKSLHQSNKITSLESKQKTNAIILIVVIIVVVGTVAFSLFSRFKSRKKSEFLASQLAYTEQLLEEKQRASESEIKAIKSQMNPHFFYNALNSIQGYVLTGEQQKASESIGLFSELSRAVLESSRMNEISLHDELELLESYLKLECMRMPKIKYSIEKSEDLRLFDLYLPPMIVQPIVENSVKHGLANKGEGGLIQLRFTAEEDCLLIEIEDDGIGREAAGKIGSFTKRKGSSFSTEANLNRIELLNESFGLAISQEIVDNFDQEGKACGTLIRIKVPQNNV